MIEAGTIWKNKETGNQVFVGGVIRHFKSDHLVHEIALRDATGNYIGGVEEDAFKEEYEQTIPDFSGLLPNLLEFAINDYNLREGIMKLARRLHPGGYFHPGISVFIINDYLDQTILERGENVEKPYIVKNIKILDPLSQLLILEPTVYGNNIKVPLYLDKFESTDAFTCLRRYDLPY